MCRVRRAPAVLDLNKPAVAVWPGEVVIVAVPNPGELRALLAAVRACGGHRTAVREPRPAYEGGDDAHIRALADSAARGCAVLAGVRLAPGPSARRALAALRAGVARRVPCRCLWLVGGRVYPE